MQQAGGRRQYIGPPTDIPAPRIFALSEPGSGSSQLDSTTTPDEHYSSGERAYAYSQLLSGNSSVDLHRVQASTEIGKMLNRLDEYADNLGNSDFESAVRRFRYTISSLPVPVDLHDTWIKKQVDAGNRWVPRRLSHRRNEIKGMADEATLDAQILEDAITTVDTILSELEGNNPLIDHLLSILDDAAKDDLQVGILVRKKTYKDMLKHYLEENASEWALGDNLLLFDEDTIRNTSHREIDWLVTFGTLPPQSAIYYHHPATETTHVIGFADGELYSRLRGVEAKRRPFLPPTTNVDLPGIDVEKHGATIDSESTEWSFTDDLYRTFLSVASKSGQHSESGRGVGQTPTSYRVGFSDGTELTLSDVHPIVVRSEEYLVSTGEYVLKSLEWVSRGDEIVVMEPDTRERLWESFLKERWDESGSEDGEDYDEAFMDAVRLWYSAVETGLEAQDTPDDSMYGAETGFANDIVDKVSVGGDAVRDWARSVMSADEASDLVFQRSLRIGPQNPESVKAVAEEFGDNRFQENWEQVYTQIKSIRSIHRKSGHVFWEWVADRADDGSLFDEPGIALKSVESCRETG